METDTHYRQTLEKAKSDLIHARAERERAIQLQEESEQRIIELRRTVAALAALCGEEFNEDDEFGLTDSIRMAMKTYGGYLNAQQVKTRLEQMGYRSNSTNLLASVHTVLKRLVLKGELDDSVMSENKPAYRWVGKAIPIPPPAPVPMRHLGGTVVNIPTEKK